MNTEHEFDPSAPYLPLRRQIHPAASIPPDAEPPPSNTIDFRSSDSTLDRYQEVITVAGWKLDTYRKNPVVQNAHNYCSLADTIGKSIITEVRGDHLFQRVQFAVEENPMAKIAYGLYKGGFLNAVSVGFIPLRWENGTKDVGYRRRYLEQELLEVSAVSLPANPNALTLAIKAGAIEINDLKELAEFLSAFCRNIDDRLSDTSSLGAPFYQIRLLHLQKQMNEIRANIRRGKLNKTH
jgi:HK97 family phage prohead protease